MKKLNIKITVIALLLAVGSVTASTLVRPAFYKIGPTVFETSADDACVVQPNGVVCTIIVNGQQYTLYDTAANANAQGTVGILRRP